MEAFLDGVIAATNCGLFQTVTLNLQAPVLLLESVGWVVELAAVMLFAASLALLIGLPRLNATRLILGGAIAGWLLVSLA